MIVFRYPFAYDTRAMEVRLTWVWCVICKGCGKSLTYPYTEPKHGMIVKCQLCGERRRYRKVEVNLVSYLPHDQWPASWKK